MGQLFLSCHLGSAEATGVASYAAAADDELYWAMHTKLHTRYYSKFKNEVETRKRAEQDVITRDAAEGKEFCEHNAKMWNVVLLLEEKRSAHDLKPTGAFQELLNAEQAINSCFAESKEARKKQKQEEDLEVETQMAKQMAKSKEKKDRLQNENAEMKQKALCQPPS